MLDQATYIPDETESGKLPQDIINVCRKISKKAYEAADPTRISHLEITGSLDTYRIGIDPYKQLFASLVMRPILNVSEVLCKNDRFLSLGIDLEKVQEETSYYEVSGDLILLNLILGGNFFDRGWYSKEYDVELRGVSNPDKITEQHNFIYYNKRYSIFDLEIGSMGIYQKGTSDILKHIADMVRELHSKEPSIEQEIEQNSTYRSKVILRRLLSKLKEFLRHYADREGKYLLFTQIQKSGIQIDDRDKFYDNFIENITTLIRFLNNYNA